MGVSTLSNRTVKLNRSDEEDSKKEEKPMPTVKPQDIKTPKPQVAKFQGSMFY